MSKETWELVYGLNITKRVRERWMIVRNTLTTQQVAELRDIASEVEHEKSTDKYRTCTMGPLYPATHEWLYRKYSKVMQSVNDKQWRMGVTGFYQPIAICTYGKGGFIAPHTDYTPDSNTKLGMVVMLSGKNEYGGGRLVFEDERMPPMLNPGDAIVFPGYELHRVNAVTRGKRVILAGWMQGPEWC
jgi:hypothetical protein